MIRDYPKRLSFVICLNLALFLGSYMATGSVLAQSDGYPPNPALSKGVEALDYEYWISIKDSENPAAFREYLKVFPEGIYAGLVRARIDELQNTTPQQATSSDLIAKLQALETYNQELIRQLRSSMAFEKQVGIENEGLRIKYSSLREEVGELQLKLGTALAQKERFESVRDQLQKEIKSLANLLSAQQQDKSGLGERNTTLRAELAALGELKRALQQEHDRLNADYEQASSEVTALQAGRSDLQIEIVKLRNELQSLREDYAELTQASKLGYVTQDSKAIQDLKELVSALQFQLSRQENVVKSLSKEKASLSGKLRAVGEQYRLTKEELDFLRAEYTEEVAAFDKEQELLREELEALEILKARHTKLESDYNRLVKPARSKFGRYVVSIHYWKDQSGHHYRLRLPEDSRHRDLTRAQLHTQLKALKKQHGTKLYTAVWFPDDTSLSHAEASSFTSRIHSLYDYYYSRN